MNFDFNSLKSRPILAAGAGILALAALASPALPSSGPFPVMAATGPAAA
jgi:hypothetical protein